MGVATTTVIPSTQANSAIASLRLAVQVVSIADDPRATIQIQNGTGGIEVTERTGMTDVIGVIGVIEGTYETNTRARLHPQPRRLR